MQVAIEARFDRRCVTLQVEIDVPCKRIRPVIALTTDADAADV